MEKYLIRLAVLGVLVLVIVQGLMTADPIRFYLSWGERLEGQTITYPVSADKERNDSQTLNQIESPYTMFAISVDKYSSLPRARILVNGQEKYDLSENPAKITVRAGDTVEIDSSFYNFPIDFKVNDTAANLAYPGSGQLFTADQGVVMLGKVIVK